MKIALIVADAPHLKTEQVALRLSQQDRYDITIVTVPFMPRKARSPLFHHRPAQSASPNLDDLANGLGLRLVRTASGIDDFDPSDMDYCLLTGGVLMPVSFIKNAEGRVLNCHPGLIPECRGLDAFKWAIVNGEQVGNTLHFIDERVDLGFVLERRATPVFATDTLESFALRHYDSEVRLLADFENHLTNPPRDAAEMTPIGKAYKRMKSETEATLREAFNAYKRKHSKQ